MSLFIKRIFEFSSLILVSGLFFYVLYEWMQEWIDSSSKFNFGLDTYTIFGISNLLFLGIIMMLLGQKIKPFSPVDILIRYCINVMIGLSGIILCGTLIEIFQFGTIWAVNSIFFSISLMFVLFGIIAKRGRTKTRT